MGKGESRRVCVCVFVCMGNVKISIHRLETSRNNVRVLINCLDPTFAIQVVHKAFITHIPLLLIHTHSSPWEQLCV